MSRDFVASRGIDAASIEAAKAGQFGVIGRDTVNHGCQQDGSSRLDKEAMAKWLHRNDRRVEDILKIDELVITERCRLKA